MSFFQIILILVLLYFFFRFFTSLILPWALKILLKRFQKKFFDQNPNLRNQQTQEKGRVTIHRVNEKEGTDIPPDLGEYIDYEDLTNHQTSKNE